MLLSSLMLPLNSLIRFVISLFILPAFFFEHLIPVNEKDSEEVEQEESEPFVVIEGGAFIIEVVDMKDFLLSVHEVLVQNTGWISVGEFAAEIMNLQQTGSIGKLFLVVPHSLFDIPKHSLPLRQMRIPVQVELDVIRVFQEIVCSKGTVKRYAQ